MRRHLTLAAATAALALAAGPAHAAPTTTVETYTPFSAPSVLKPGLKVVAERLGDCGRPKYDDPGASGLAGGAYRCYPTKPVPGGSTIVDPCFPEVDPDGVTPPDSVICASSPTATKLVRIYTRPLPPIPAKSLKQPWGLRISGGRTCTLISGATTVVRGERTNYSCSGRGLRVLLGTPKRSKPTWSIVQLKSYQGKSPKRVKVLHVWF